MSAIDDKFTALGGAGGFLGSPTTTELVCPDGVGHYRHYQNGSIYWHPLTGAHEVHGLIRSKWAKLGWEKSFPGYPKTDESNCPVQGGKYSLFQVGTILWFPPSKEAFEVHGAIRSKFVALGCESGFLGFPLTDETKTPDGIGRFNHFQGGSVYWKPSISAHEVHGLIKAYWANHGWETNPDLGYPISDELPTAAGSKNRCSDFENGVVFWKYGDSSAFPLSKLTIGGASKTAAEVMAQINAIIVPKITANSSIYINNGPYLAEVTDYSFDGSAVHNRRYKVHVDLGIDVPVFSDPTSNLNLWIEISYDKAAKIIRAYLTNWWVHTHVPWDTHSIAGVDAADINNQFHAALDPLIWKPNDMATIPAGVNILVVKVMPNGDLNVYMETACFITTACVEAQGLADDCEELKVLRTFRDEFVAKLPGGQEMLLEYDWIASQIVHAINKTKNPKTVYQQLFEDLVKKSVLLINSGKRQEAYDHYLKVTNELKQKYLK